MKKFDTNCQSLVDTVYLVADAPYPSLNWKDQRDNSYGTSFRGEIKNLNIFYNNGKIKIQGSFSKYYNDENLNNISLNDLEEAIGMLSKDVQIDLGDAIITQIDLAGNVTLNQDVSSYFKCLASYDRTSRFENGSSLYFLQGGKTKLLFYDKGKEIGKAEAQRLGVTDTHIMRYELKLRKADIKNLFKIDLALKNLTDSNINAKLTKHWLTQYQNIKKYSPSSFNLKPRFGDKALMTALAKQGIDSLGGLAECTERLKRELFYQQLRSDEKIRRRKLLNKISGIGESTIPDNLLVELDKAFSDFWP